MKTQTTGYTPRPWTFCHSDPEADHPFYVISEPDGQMDAPDISIAIIEYSGNNFDPATINEDREKAETNARLIAAAPDLLQALKAQILPRAKGWKKVDWAIRDEEARAAIDKAKGDRGKRSHCGDLQKRRTTRRGIRTS